MSGSNKEIFLVDTDSELMEPNQNLANYLVKQLSKSNGILANKFQSGTSRMDQANTHIEQLSHTIVSK